MLIPAIVQALHAFEHHDHSVVYNIGMDDQLYQGEEECAVCQLTFNSAGLLHQVSYEIPVSPETQEQIYFYTSRIDHQELSYSLRGPPSL